MKNQIKGILALLLTLVTVLSFGFTSNAEGKTTLYISDDTPKVGENFQLKVEGTESSAITVKYNNKVLSVVDCDAPGFTTDGNTVTFSAKTGIVTFKANATGSSSFIVSSDKLEGSSTKVDFSDGSSSSTDTEANTSEETSSKEESTSKKAATGEPDFVINSTNYVLSERFSDDEIPSGFEVEREEIHGHTYKVLVSDPFTLVYLKEASNLNGKGEFFIYDSANDVAEPFNCLVTDDRYIVISDTDDVPLDNMMASTIVVNDKEVPVYVIDGYEGLAFIYGYDFESGLDWYVYDINAGTYQVADMSQYAPVEEEEVVVAEKDDDLLFGFLNKRYLIAFGIFLAVLVLIIVINVILKKRDDDYYDEDDDDEDEDDESAHDSKSKDSSDEIVEYVTEVSESEADKPYAEDDDEEEFAFWEDEKTIRKAKKAKAKAAKKAAKKRKALEDDEDTVIDSVPEEATGSSDDGEDYKYEKKEVESANKIDIMDLNNL